ERCAGSNARQCDRLAVALSQFVGSAKIIGGRVILGYAEPGVGQPVGMLRSRSRKFGGIATLRPIREEREFLRLAERIKLGIVLQDFAKGAVEISTGNSREIWQGEIVTTDTELSEIATDLGTSQRVFAQHARKHAGTFRSGAAQRFPPRGRGQDRL